MSNNLARGYSLALNQDCFYDEVECWKLECLISDVDAYGDAFKTYRTHIKSLRLKNKTIKDLMDGGYTHDKELNIFYKRTFFSMIHIVEISDSRIGGNKILDFVYNYNTLKKQLDRTDDASRRSYERLAKTRPS